MVIVLRVPSLTIFVFASAELVLALLLLLLQLLVISRLLRDPGCQQYKGQEQRHQGPSQHQQD